MTVLPFNAMHAAVDPRGVLIRDHLAEAGETHGRGIADTVLSRLSMALPGAPEAAVAIIDDEGARMARIYAEAGCSRRQVRAFVHAFVRGSAARAREAAALAASDHQGSG